LPLSPPRPAHPLATALRTIRSTMMTTITMVAFPILVRQPVLYCSGCSGGGARLVHSAYLSSLVEVLSAADRLARPG
jgi:hypothetical protein